MKVMCKHTNVAIELNGGNVMAYLGEEIKKLGFGLMRLPQKDGQIDIDQTKEMVDLFMQEPMQLTRLSARIMRTR